MREDQIQTVTFDSFSTVVDVHTAEEKLADYVDNPSEVSKLWRSYVWKYRPLANFIGYVSHHEINRSALEYVFDILEIDASDDTLEEIASVYYEMEPFEDVREGMERLHEKGYDLYIISNGNMDVLNSMISNAEIEDLIEDMVSANEIKTYKPHERLYKHAARRIGTPVDNILHVSAAWPDVQGGMYAGMKGAWVNRENKPRGLEPFDSDPDLIIDDFIELSDEL